VDNIELVISQSSAQAILRRTDNQ